MNCTARMSASANHFFLSEPTMGTPVSSLKAFRVLSRRGMLHDLTCDSQVTTFNSPAGSLHSERWHAATTQYCPMAHALDIVGERWSLLIVRELLEDDQLRYSDLHARLDGCGTNILAARLKTLEQGGVVRRKQLEPPAASWVYELTEYGRGLREVLHVLAHWGARSLGPPADDATTSSRAGSAARCGSRSRPTARAGGSSSASATSSPRSPPARSSRARSTSPMRSSSVTRSASIGLWSTATSTPSRSRATPMPFGRCSRSLPNLPSVRRGRRLTRAEVVEPPRLSADADADAPASA